MFFKAQSSPQNTSPFLLFFSKILDLPLFTTYGSATMHAIHMTGKRRQTDDIPCVRLDLTLGQKRGKRKKIRGRLTVI